MEFVLKNLNKLFWEKWKYWSQLIIDKMGEGMEDFFMAIYGRSHIQFAYFIFDFIFYSKKKPFENIVIFSVDIAVIITFD